VSRRAHGEGSVFQQADGRWVARLELPRDPVTGRRRRRKVTAATQAEALRKRDQLRRDLEGGADRADHRTKVADWLREWSDTELEYALELGRLRPSTVESYRRLTRNHLLPHLGGIVLRDLDPASIERAYVTMMRGGLKPSSVARVHSVLGAALESAVRSRRLVTNPARLVDPPRVERTEAPFLEPGQVRTLLDAAPDRDRALWGVMAYAGLRIGEALGLAWDVVDLDAGVLHVRQTLRDAKGARAGVALGPPKTRASVRTVPLAGPLVELLRTHRRLTAQARLAAPAWDATCPAVFPTLVGTWTSQSNAQRRFRKLRDQLGLPTEVRPHTLRHSAGAALRSAGVPPLEVAAILGHDAASTTALYTHLTDRDARLREAVERAWGSR
jgi:integrase